MNENTEPLNPATRTRKGHPGKIKDEVGHRYERLLVLEMAGRNISQQVEWRCKCDCGKETVVCGAALRAGTVVSCGCYGAEQRLKATRKHGLSNSKIYGSYKSMISRCTNPNDIDWKYYGGRGITVCDRWMESVENFYADMSPTWQEELTIERKNVNLGYSPENCCWITMKEQGGNKRNTRRFEYKGEFLMKTELAAKAGISLACFLAREKMGWPLEKIMTQPKQKKTFSK